MSGHVTDRLGDFLAGRLGPDELKGIEDHLKKCDACSSELSWARRLREEALRQGLRHVPPERIVEIADARAAASPAEQEHIAVCPDCAGELRWAEATPSEEIGEEEGEAEADTGLARRRPVRVWVGAGLAAAALLLVVLLPRFIRIDATELARIEPLPVRISRSVPTAGSFEEHRLMGLETYAGADYGAATRHLEDALALRPNDPEVLLHLGSAQLLLGDRRAPGTLKLARESAGDGVLAEKASWQLANAFLATGHEPEAKRLLEEIASGQGRRRKDAADLLDALGD